MTYEMYKDRGGTLSEAEYQTRNIAKERNFNERFSGGPSSGSFGTGLSGGKGELRNYNSRNPRDFGTRNQLLQIASDPKLRGAFASRPRPERPAPLTGTTEEGVMDNFQPDPERDLAKNLLDQTVANVEPDKGSTATPTMDQQRDAGVQELETKAAAAPSSGQMASTTNTPQVQTEPDPPTVGAPEAQFESDTPAMGSPEGQNFMQEYADIPAEKPQVNTEATFPEYMSQYSPKTAGDFGNMGASYSQDNEYSNYQDYNSPGQYQAEQMQGFGPYDIENFMSSQSVPQQQNNFSQAGNFFSDAYGQMEQAATQETTADKRRNRFAAAGSAANRY